MSQLFDKSMQTLELNRVLELLSACAVTEEGKERALSLRPMTDLDDVRQAQEETTAAVNMLLARGTPSFSGVHPVAASLQRADMGGSLNTRELLDIAAVLRAARKGDHNVDPAEFLHRSISRHTNRGIITHVANCADGRIGSNSVDLCDRRRKRIRIYIGHSNLAAELYESF